MKIDGRIVTSRLFGHLEFLKKISEGHLYLSVIYLMPKFPRFHWFKEIGPQIGAFFVRALI